MFGQASGGFRDAAVVGVPLTGRLQADGILSLEFDGSIHEFAVVMTDSSYPSALQQAYRQALLLEDLYRLPALVVTPHLRDEQLSELAINTPRISAVDLCGNAVIRRPGLRIYQRGYRNRFPESRGIKNVFRGNSSIVARVFLTSPIQSSVAAIHRRITEDGLSLGKAAISKVLSELINSFIIRKDSDGYVLWDARSLLKKLDENYRIRFQKDEQISVKISENSKDIPAVLQHAALSLNGLCSMNGATSFSQYVAGASSGPASFYTTVDPFDLLQRLSDDGISWSLEKVFPNVKLAWCLEQAVYFDRRLSGDVWYSSPVQSYLELRRGDPRQQQMAEGLKQLIANEVSACFMEQNIRAPVNLHFSQD